MPSTKADAANSAIEIPLCIDLDGTLIRTDLLFESALALLKHNPLFIAAFPIWLLRGRANLKREIGRRVRLDVATLPYDARVIERMRETHGQRPVLLCTASDAALANIVAAHVGYFDEVLASDGTRNLSGTAKAMLLAQRFGERGFDYAGNSARDLPVWAHARHAIVVNGSAGLVARARKASESSEIMPRERAGLRAWLRALRLHQWLKNVLVFVPLAAAHLLFQPEVSVRAIAAFILFGVCASGVYVLNDLLDLEADRRHPRKRARAFAAGRLTLAAGLVVSPLLTIAALAGAWMLSWRLAALLLGYFILTLLYSLKFKQIAMLDVVVLAALYTSRIIAGGIVIGTGLSFWLLAFSMFLFLSLAILKRYTELGAQREAGGDIAPGRGYATSDYELLASLGGASGYLSVLVLALYINSAASAELYRHPQMLWLLCPLLLYWISRAWIIAHRGAMHDDPVIFALTDNVSRLVAVLGALIAVLAI